MKKSFTDQELMETLKERDRESTSVRELVTEIYGLLLKSGFQKNLGHKTQAMEYEEILQSKAVQLQKLLGKYFPEKILLQAVFRLGNSYFQKK